MCCVSVRPIVPAVWWAAELERIVWAGPTKIETPLLFFFSEQRRLCCMGYFKNRRNKAAQTQIVSAHIRALQLSEEHTRPASDSPSQGTPAILMGQTQLPRLPKNERQPKNSNQGFPPYNGTNSKIGRETKKAVEPSSKQQTRRSNCAQDQPPYIHASMRLESHINDEFTTAQIHVHKYQCSQRQPQIQPFATKEALCMFPCILLTECLRSTDPTLGSII